MRIWGRKVSVKMVAAAAALMVIAALLPVMTSSVDREVTLVARGMAFYVEGDPTPNPTITVKAGETVRVVLQNEDRGMTHDFAVPALGAVTQLINWNESGTVIFEVPSEPGAYEYICSPHRLMMRGVIRVIP